MIEGVQKGSILVSLLFHIFLNYLFSSPTETFLSNYRDNNTLSAISDAMSKVKKALNPLTVNVPLT